MFDVGNEGADKPQVFDILFDEEPVVYIETDAVGIFLEKEFTVFPEFIDRIYLEQAENVILYLKREFFDQGLLPADRQDQAFVGVIRFFRSLYVARGRVVQFRPLFFCNEVPAWSSTLFTRGTVPGQYQFRTGQAGKKKAREPGPFSLLAIWISVYASAPV